MYLYKTPTFLKSTSFSLFPAKGIPLLLPIPKIRDADRDDESNKE